MHHISAQPAHVSLLALPNGNLIGLSAGLLPVSYQISHSGRASALSHGSLSNTWDVNADQVARMHARHRSDKQCAFADAELVLGLYHAIIESTHEVLWVIAQRDQQMLDAHGLKLPAHVHACTFAPQNDVLGHANTIAFVTQGGTNSVHEVCHDSKCGICLTVLLSQIRHKAARGAACSRSCYDQLPW